jgi:predicted membrane protein
MFRITIGSVDWWYDIFPIVESDGSISIRASMFLISYVILVNWFFFQITIAVLLEICQASNRDKEKKRAEKLIMQKQREKALKNPLDRLLLDLSKEYVCEDDLEHHLHHLFSVDFIL